MVQYPWRRTLTFFFQSSIISQLPSFKVMLCPTLLYPNSHNNYPQIPIIFIINISFSINHLLPSHIPQTQQFFKARRSMFTAYHLFILSEALTSLAACLDTELIIIIINIILYTVTFSIISSSLILSQPLFMPYRFLWHLSICLFSYLSIISKRPQTLFFTAIVSDCTIVSGIKQELKKYLLSKLRT